MATLQLATPPAPLDLIPAASDALGPGAQSAEGQSIDKGALDAWHLGSGRAGVLLSQEGMVFLAPGRSPQNISEVQPADPGELISRRRLFLINKKFHTLEGLSGAEEDELRRLQADFESYLDSIRPLPTQVLEELEALAEQLEAEDQRS
jgi:hypothetical protein